MKCHVRERLPPETRSIMKNTRSQPTPTRKPAGGTQARKRAGVVFVPAAPEAATRKLRTARSHVRRLGPLRPLRPLSPPNSHTRRWHPSSAQALGAGLQQRHANTQTHGWHRLARKRAGVVFNLSSRAPYLETKFVMKAHRNDFFSAEGAQDLSLG